MKTSHFKAVTALVFTVLAFNSHADQAKDGKDMDRGGMKMDCKDMQNMKDMQMDCTGSDPEKPMSMSNGKVKAVDKANKTITLQHGPIKSKTVEMTAMTMTFPVQEASMLSNVKVGDKVKFTVENVKDEATVTALKVQK